MDRSMTSRRSFLIGLGSALAAPAVIRTAGLLMPVRKVIEPEVFLFDLMRANFEKMIRPPMVASSEMFNLPFALMPGCVTYVGHDLFKGREFIDANWPSRTIKAPPGGFKVERA